MPLTFKLNGEEYTLPNETLAQMANTLDKTKVKERGFRLCLNEEIDTGPEHIGGPNSIGVRDCSGRTEVGCYHTHPGSRSEPSWWDAYHILWNANQLQRRYLGCRGGTDDKTIRCDTVKDIPSVETVGALRAKRTAKKFSWAEHDPELWQHFAEGYSFPVSEVDSLIRVKPFRDKEVAGFAVHGFRNRAEIIAELHRQFPDIPKEKIDFAQITYYNDIATVKLR